MMIFPVIVLYLILIFFQKSLNESFFLALISIFESFLPCVVFSPHIENSIQLKLLFLEYIMIYYLPPIVKRSLLLSFLTFRQPLTPLIIKFYSPGLAHSLVSLVLR